MGTKKLLFPAILVSLASIPAFAYAQDTRPVSPDAAVAAAKSQLAPMVGTAGFVPTPPGLGGGSGLMLGGANGQPLPPPFMMALRSADLTEDQQEKLRDILEDSKTESQPDLDELHSIHEKIADKLLSAGSISETDLTSLARQAGKLEEKIQENSVKTALRIRGILSNEQIAKMGQFNQRMTSIHSQIEALMHKNLPNGMSGTDWAERVRKARARNSPAADSTP